MTSAWATCWHGAPGSPPSSTGRSGRVGDPRVDVGWFLLNADPETYARPTRYAGLTPTLGELAAEYADALGAPVPDLTWFQALASFKSAATWSLIVKHNRRRRGARRRARVDGARPAAPAGPGSRVGRLGPWDAGQAVGEFRLGRGPEPQEVLAREEIGGRFVVLEELTGQRDLVHLGGAVGQAEDE